jgi:hypothetical protein
MVFLLDRACSVLGSVRWTSDYLLRRTDIDQKDTDAV